MKCNKVLFHITEWLKEQLKVSSCGGFVVGVSGGIDSALTSTLACMTGRPVICLSMPIRQAMDQHDRSLDHMSWLSARFPNVVVKTIDLGCSLGGFESDLVGIEVSDLAYANLRSRIRMCALYTVANSNGYLVCGTGNKVEDYGIGFFTKYGDGGVDISPIADLLKSEVYELSKFLKILDSIITAKPCDGLWGDNRGDEEQIGASYDELEWALKFVDSKESKHGKPLDLSDRNRKVFHIYMHRHLSNGHKLKTPPVCIIPNDMKF
jgi:NAD+ synthase